MCKNPVDMLAEKLLTFIPIMTKKIIRLDMQANKILPVNQLVVLGILDDEGILSISEICKKVYVSKPQMTIIIDNLVKKGLVYRVYGKEDRRIINIDLTEEGKEYLRSLLEMFKENLSHKLIALSRGDLVKLLNSIEIMESILRQLE
ncbi:MarR family transcriptional regulator [Clostridium sp. OS1-26]|uniref:MarR family winged helix-turn-helix transcriptional regulator n=1 Tax=Clostridium sp. OS1-26 TaxID=3070681 RepID=UPI0027DF3E3B|nr:MarR family transcriptional regulator [Clostridium sp. OS1-26]WML36991.1 MarR family transcriptional regulator [Clostridium sp. OS1-26]